MKSSNDFSMDHFRGLIDPKTFDKAKRSFGDNNACSCNKPNQAINRRNGKISVNDFSDLRAPEFTPSIWFKLFPCSLTVKIPDEFMKQCYHELKQISGGDFIGEDLYAFAYEKYTGRDIMDGANGILYFCCIAAFVMLGIAKYLDKL